MGNKNVQEALQRFRDTEFNIEELAKFEPMLWTDLPLDDNLFTQMKGLMSDENLIVVEHHSLIDTENSGLDSDEKRQQDLTRESWQAGFTTPQKKHAMLKQGDFKKVVIPNNMEAAQFNQCMQLKVFALMAKFYARNQGTAEDNEDFFTYAQKQIEVNESDKIASCILAAHSIPNVNEAFVDTMLEATKDFTAKSQSDTSEVVAFFDEMQNRKVTNALLDLAKASTTKSKKELAAKCITLTFRYGLIHACPATLLKTVALANQFKVDISSEMSFLCKMSEKVTNIGPGGNENFETTDQERCSSHVYFQCGGGDNTQIQDKMVSDGTHWYIYRHDKPFIKGTKEATNGDFKMITNVESKFDERSLLVMKNRLYVRHSKAPDQPFIELNRDTLVATEEQVTFTGKDGSEMPLKWTPTDTVYEEDKEVGNRWARQIPLFFDGDLLNVLVPYRRKDNDSELVRIVLESYEIKGTELHLMSEVTLLAQEEGKLFKTDVLEGDETQIQECTFACNGRNITFFSAHQIWVFDQESGEYRYHHSPSSSTLITTYDPMDNYFYYMDVSSYGYLDRFKIKGFKPKVLGEKTMKMPNLPIVLDQSKGLFLSSISAKKEAEKTQNNDQTEGYNLFRMLVNPNLAEESKFALKNHSIEECKIENVHGLTKSIILSVMGNEAHKVLQEVKSLGMEKLLGEEMLKFFRRPFSVSVTNENLICIIELLQDSVKAINTTAKPTPVQYSEALSLLKLMTVNFICMRKCRINPKHVLSESEIKKFQDFAEQGLSKITKIQTRPYQGVDHDDFTPQDIFKIHIVEIAKDLEKIILQELDFGSKTIILIKLEQSLSNLMLNGSGEPDVIALKLAQVSTDEALEEIFNGDLLSILQSKKVLKQSLTNLNKYYLESIEKLIADNSQGTEMSGLYENLNMFVRKYSQEMFFAFGKQQLIIEDNKDLKEMPDMTKEDRVKLNSVTKALEKKDQLEGIFIDTLLLISTFFKEQLFCVSQKMWEAKPYNWNDDERIERFFNRLTEMHGQELSLSRVILQLTLYMCSYLPKVTWLDEIAEALKNCAIGLNHFISMSDNFPVQAASKIYELNTTLPWMKMMLRNVTFGLGNVSCQLIQRNFGEGNASDAMSQLSKLNILQGGIEQRFIPQLSQETKTQIEGSYKIISNLALQKLSLASSEQVTYSKADKVLAAVVDKEQSDVTIELAINLLQFSLQNKKPMVMHAKLGGEDGTRLNRAAFAVIVKFSNQTSVLTKFIKTVQDAAIEISANSKDVNGLIIEKLNSYNDQDFTAMQQRWEQASQMRKWTQFIKLKISEKVKQEIQQAFVKELNEANPSQAASTGGGLNQEQRQTVETRSNEQFDKELQLKYTEVVDKAKLLIKLQVPKAFIDAQKALENERNPLRAAVNNFEMSLHKQANSGMPMLSNRSGQSNLSATFKMPTLVSNDGLQMTLLKGKAQGQGPILISGSKLGQKDKTVDWRDQLKNWRKVQLSQNAVNSMADKNQEVFQSCSVSVLGCLQASFSAEQLQNKVEETLVNGLRRSAGLHMMKYSMEQSHSSKVFFDMLQWFQSALRSNKSKSVHYLHNIDGCGVEASQGIKVQFFSILERIIYQIKNEDFEQTDPTVSDENPWGDKLTHLINALCCWDFQLDDHEGLVHLDIFKHLLKPNDDPFHAMTLAWGKEKGYHVVTNERSESLNLPVRLNIALQYLLKNIISSVVVEDSSMIEDHGQTAQSKMAGHKGAFNKDATETLLSQVLDAIFANFERYLKAPGEASKNSRFKSEDYVDIEADECPIKTDASIISDTYYSDVHGKGGMKVIKGNRKIKQHLKYLKIALFIEKVTSVEITKNSMIYKILRKLIGRSIPTTIERVVQRKFDAIDAINNSSWEALDLVEPELSEEDKAKITGIEVDEWKKLNALKGKKEIDNSDLPENPTLQQRFDFWKDKESVAVEEDDEDSDNKASQGKYDEVALFKLMEALDNYLSLSYGYPALTISIAEKICQPSNLAILIRVSVCDSPNISFMAHRILQDILRFDVPVDVLNVAVQIAEATEAPKEQPLGFNNEVRRLLSLESPLDLSGCRFLQLYFNQLFEERKGLELNSIEVKPVQASIVDEAVRTLRISAVIIDKNVEIKKILDDAVRQALLQNVQSMTATEIDAIFSLVPEAQFERIAIGTPCQDKDGKHFTVCGVIDDDQSNEKSELKYTISNDSNKLVGLFYDPVSPEQQDIVFENLVNTRTLIDLDDNEAIEGARRSILHDGQVVDLLISIVSGSKPAPKDAKAFDLLKTFVARGLFAMTSALGSEYVKFLSELGLNVDLLKFLLRTTMKDHKIDNQQSALSATHLELQADRCREVIQQNHEGYKELIESNGGTLKTVKVEGGEDDQELLKLSPGEEQYEIMAKFGKDDEDHNEWDVLIGGKGAILENKAVLIDSHMLNVLSEHTIININSARVVITDLNVDFETILTTLTEIKQRKLFPVDNVENTSFIVIDTGAFVKLTEILSTNLPEKDQDEEEEEGKEEEKDDATDSKESIQYDFAAKLIDIKKMPEEDRDPENDSDPGIYTRIPNDMFRANCPEQESESDKEQKFGERFKEIFTNINAEAEEGDELTTTIKFYKQLLPQMQAVYSRKLLRMIFGNEDGFVLQNEDQIKKFIRSIHNDYQTVAYVKSHFGLTYQHEKCKDEILSVMKNLHSNQKFREMFLTDFFTRAKNTIDYYEKDEEVSFTVENLSLIEQDEIQKLNPNNLIFLQKVIQDLEYIEENKLAQWFTKILELNLVHAALYGSKSYDIMNHEVRTDLYRVCIKTLQEMTIKKSLFNTEEQKTYLNSFFNSQLIKDFFHGFCINESKAENDLINQMQILIFEFLIQMIKLGKAMSIKIPFELTNSVQEYLKLHIIIEQGSSFETYVDEMKLDMTLVSMEQSHSVKHLGQYYESDKHRFTNVQFETILTADEHDMNLVFESLPKADLMRFEKKSQGEEDFSESMTIDATKLMNPEDSVLSIEKGQTVRLRFPCPIESVVKVIGMMTDSEKFPDVDSELQILPGSKKLGGKKIFANHQWVLIQDGQKFYTFGQRCRRNTKSELLELKFSEEKQKDSKIKKVTTGKFVRYILMEGNQIFVQGRSRQYQFCDYDNHNQREEMFVSVDLQYWPFVEEDEIIVDIAGGKKCWAFVTDKGRLYCAGLDFASWFPQSIRHHHELGVEYPWRVDMPSGYRALKVWLHNKNFQIYITAEDENTSKFKTFHLGQRYRSQDQHMDYEFQEVENLPQDTYFTSIESDFDMVVAIDQDQKLWTWNSVIGCDNDLYSSIVEQRNNNQHEYTPKYVKWFSDKELKIIKAECGKNHIVVQTLDKDQKTGFYGMMHSMNEQIEQFFGSVVRIEMENKICKILVDAERILDFSCTRFATIFLEKPIDVKAQPSIIPDQPEANGLIHFYKENGSWKFMSEEQYEAKKDNLPSICFATRNKISQFDSKPFPDLKAISNSLTQGDLGVVNTATGEKFAASEPVYFSYATINGEEQKIYATEAQVRDAMSQKWDLNPLIFYRVKNSRTSLDQLPCINLKDFFKQGEVESDQIRFKFIRKVIDQADLDALQVHGQVKDTMERATSGFTAEQNSELLQVLNKEVSKQEYDEIELEDVIPSKVTIDKSQFRATSSLQEIPDQVLNLRKNMLIKFSQAWKELKKITTTSDCNKVGTITNMHVKARNLVLPCVLQPVVDNILGAIDYEREEPSVKLSRRKAMMFADSGMVDNQGTQTLFGQVCTILETHLDKDNPEPLFFTKDESESKIFDVSFLGEGGQDAGGLFRDCLVNIAHELESPVLPLLQRSPNNKSDFGNNRECFILNSQARSPIHMRMFKYLGCFIGFSILTKQPLPLNLAPTFWKTLQGIQSVMTMEDLNSIDSYSYNMLNNLRQYSGFLGDDEFAASIDQTFTTVLSSGDEVSLCPGGESKAVTKQNLNEFIELVLKARSAEAETQMNAIISGVKIAMQDNLEALVYLTWEGIEARASGEKIFDVEKLRSITEYPNCEETHEIVARFWRVFEAMSELEKAQYLKFVWGRTRLPIDVTGCHAHEVRLMEDMDKNGFPQSHTCFFQLDIPDYQNDEICRQRMTQAAELCGQIDNDNADVEDEDQ